MPPLKDDIVRAPLQPLDWVARKQQVLATYTTAGLRAPATAFYLQTNMNVYPPEPCPCGEPHSHVSQAITLELNEETNTMQLIGTWSFWDPTKSRFVVCRTQHEADFAREGYVLAPAQRLRRRAMRFWTTRLRLVPEGWAVIRPSGSTEYIVVPYKSPHISPAIDRDMLKTIGCFQLAAYTSDLGYLPPMHACMPEHALVDDGTIALADPKTQTRILRAMKATLAYGKLQFGIMTRHLGQLMGQLKTGVTV